MSSVKLALVNKAIQRQKLLRSHLEFTKYFFEAKEGQPLIVGPYHEVLCKTLDRVFSGEIKRLIINVPPRYGKTEIAVKNFVARGFAINPGSRFIHSSYSDELALDNSSDIRELIQLEEYQDFWPISHKVDTKAKGLWRTSEGGGLKASAAGKAITGFGAGRMVQEGEEWEFNGALIIDDPLKPDDALSDATRKAVNNRWATTFRSRLADDKNTPVIVIMQRLHINDFVGHLLDESGEKWHVLKLPLLLGEETEPHPNAIMVEHGLPDGPLWDYKHDLESIETVKKALGPVFDGQYQQEPIVLGGNLFKKETLVYYKDVPKLQWRGIYVDTAQKTAERNDFSVFQEWGKGVDGKAYLLDMARGKFEAPELEATGWTFWNKCKARNPEHYGHLRKMAIEDKVSGTGLIQALKRKSVPVIGIPREKDKFTRALDVIPSFSSGLVAVPEDAPWLRDYISELLAFPDGSFDDQVDPTMDAVTEMIIKKQAAPRITAL